MKNQKSETALEPPAAVKALDYGDWWNGSSNGREETPKGKKP